MRMASRTTPPIPASPHSRPTEALEQRASDLSIPPVWTEEDEEELADIKVKLHQAHKSWSADQELWQDRVGFFCSLVERLADTGHHEA
jgi:hypothetical protein